MLKKLLQMNSNILVTKQTNTQTYLCHIRDIKITSINPCIYIYIIYCIKTTVKFHDEKQSAACAFLHLLSNGALIYIFVLWNGLNQTAKRVQSRLQFFSAVFEQLIGFFLTNHTSDGFHWKYVKFVYNSLPNLNYFSLIHNTCVCWFSYRKLIIYKYLLACHLLVKAQCCCGIYGTSQPDIHYGRLLQVSPKMVAF